MEIRKFCDDYYDIIIKPMVIMIIMISLLPDHDHDHDHNHDLSSTWSNRTDRQLLGTMGERVEKS